MAFILRIENWRVDKKSTISLFEMSLFPHIYFKKQNIPETE